MPRRATARGVGRAVARWADGEPAAVERPSGRGCVRAVAVPVPQTGDAPLRAPFRALVAALTAPCDQHIVGAPLDASVVGALAGRGPLLATRALDTPRTPTDPLARWLLAAAIAVLVAELPLRAWRRAVPEEAAEREAAASNGAEAAA
jgi:hypothetical protein